MTLFKSLFTKTLVASCIGLAAVSASLQAQDLGFNKSGHQIKRMLRGLDLTTEQRQAVKQIIRETRQEARLYKEDAKQARQEVKSIVQQPDFDVQAAESAIAASSVLKMQMGLNRAETKHAIWSLLTPDQQQQWQERFEAKANKEPREFNQERQAKLFERLDFTDEQIEQAMQIRQQAFADSQALREKRQAFKQAEFTIITADEFSADAWQALHAQYVEDFNQGQLMALETRNQLFNIMTEEQRQKAQKIRKRKARKGRRNSDSV